MDSLIPLFSFMITMFIFVVIKANIEHRKDKRNEVNKSEEDKDNEWLDNQW